MFVCVYVCVSVYLSVCPLFVHDIYFFLWLYFKAKTKWNKGMSDFDSGNSVNCVLLDVNLHVYETKRENNWSLKPKKVSICPTLDEQYGDLI